MTDREVMKQALDALTVHGAAYLRHQDEYDKTIALLRTALAEEALQRLTNVQQEIEAALEPVAWWHKKSDTFASGSLISHFTDWLPLYTTPPQRNALTEDEVVRVLGNLRESITTGNVFLAFARAIEQAHGIKGEA